MKITILGGGIAGLATAIALKDTGIETEIFESAPGFKPVGAGITLFVNAYKAMKTLGLQDQLESKGHFYTQGTISTEKGKILNSFNVDLLGNHYGGKSLTIHRHDLHMILLSRSENIPVYFNKRCISVSREADQIRLGFDDGVEHTTDFLVAADGIHSVIRKFMLPESKERFSRQTCWRGICHHSDLLLDQGNVIESWGRGKRFGIVPISEQSAYWFAVADAPHPGSRLQAFSQKDLAVFFSGFHKPVEELILNTDTDSFIWNDLLDVKPIRKFAFGNILLVGDAAHATTPNLGQGGCMALEDGAVLKKLFSTEKNPAVVFKQFEAERIARTTRIVQASFQLGKIAQSSQPILAWLRNTFLPLFPIHIDNSLFRFLYGIEF